MTSEGVRRESRNDNLVAKVIKAKDAIAHVFEVSRLEGLRINEREAHKAMLAASDGVRLARKNYQAAVAAYGHAVTERKEEEANAHQTR